MNFKYFTISFRRNHFFPKYTLTLCFVCGLVWNSHRSLRVHQPSSKQPSEEKFQIYLLTVYVFFYKILLSQIPIAIITIIYDRISEIYKNYIYSKFNNIISVRCNQNMKMLINSLWNKQISMIENVNITVIHYKYWKKVLNISIHRWLHHFTIKYSWEVKIEPKN